jgi:hypothetical protein
VLAQIERSAEPSNSSYTRLVSRAERPGTSGPDQTRSGLGLRAATCAMVRSQVAAAGPFTPSCPNSCSAATILSASSLCPITDLRDTAEGEAPRTPDSSAFASLSRRCDGRLNSAPVTGQPEKMPHPGRRALVRPVPDRGNRFAFRRKSRLPRRSRDMRRHEANGFRGSCPAHAERRLDHWSTAHSFSAPAPDGSRNAALVAQGRQGSPPRQGFPCKGVCRTAGPSSPRRCAHVWNWQDSRSAQSAFDSWEHQTGQATESWPIRTRATELKPITGHARANFVDDAFSGSTGRTG